MGDKQGFKEARMARVVKCGLTQVQAPDSSGKSLSEISEEMIQLHLILVL